MIREDLKRMATEYQAKHGFLPGALVIHESDKEELREAFRDLLAEPNYVVISKLIDSDIKSIERVKIMGMGITLSKDKCEPHLTRQTGKMDRMKPQSGGDMYMPVADIVNSMPRIMSAAFSLFDKVGAEKDDIFVAFGKDCAEFMDDSRHGHVDWENEGLPNLQNMSVEFAKSDFSKAFFAKFFMCVMDFYWHCNRLVPEDDGIDSKKMIEKALSYSGVIRTMPKAMREEYLDHLITNGMLPDVMTRVMED